MFVWFAAAAFLIVSLVFNSPAIDYRLIMFGAVLPVLEGVSGSPWILHTFAGIAAVFGAVVVGTAGRRLVARKAIAVPIGLFLHLVLDGSWAAGERFWWPFQGSIGDGRLPEFDHVGVSVFLEVVGFGVAAFLVGRFDLTRPERRREFLRTGRVARGLSG